jgi:hypothetical protein
MSLTVPKKYESIKESCQRNDCSRSEFYRLLGAGKIDAIKDGRRIKIIVASADAYFAGLPKAKIKPARRANASEAAA